MSPQPAHTPDVRKFREKNTDVEAVQVLDSLTNHTQIALWIERNGGEAWLPFAASYIAIETNEGPLHAEIGDWVVRDAANRFRPHKPDGFAYAYEPIDQPDPNLVELTARWIGERESTHTWDEIREDDKACYRDAARHLLATISGGALEAIAPGAAAAAEAGRKAAQRAAEKVSIAQAGLDAAHAGQEAGMELGAAIGPQSPKWLRDIDQYAKQTALESINLALGPDVVAVQLPEPVGVNSADNRVWSHEPHYIEQEFNGDIVIDDRLGIDAADLATVGAILIAAKAKAEASE